MLVSKNNTCLERAIILFLYWWYDYEDNCNDVEFDDSYGDNYYDDC